MIRLTNEHGPVDGAVFDAAQISPDFTGIRCGISVGSNGGLICDAIDCERPFRPSIIREVATEAIVLLDNSRFEGEPEFVLTDGDGAEVEIDGENDDIDPINMDMAGSDEKEIAELRRRLPIPWPMILIIPTLFAVAVWMRYTAGEIDGVRWGFYGVCAFTALATYHLIQALRAKHEHDKLTDVVDVMAEREMERRRALDKAMERHGCERTVDATTGAGRS